MNILRSGLILLLLGMGSAVAGNAVNDEAVLSPPEEAAIPMLSAYEARLQAFDVDMPLDLLKEAIGREYTEVMRGLAMAEGCAPGHSDQQINAAWYAATWAGFYTIDERYLSAVRRCFEELSRREAVTSHTAGETYQALVRHRAFDQARALHENFPG